MKLHENKFELVCYRTPASKSLSEKLLFMSDITNYTTPDGSAIVRDLGVNMSDHYTWTPHINIMVDKAHQMASWVLGVFKDRTTPVMLQLYKYLSGILLPTLESEQDP